MRTAQFIEETKAAKSENDSVQPADDSPKPGRARSLQNLVAPWPKGVSGNPSGKRRFDVARAIAQATFEENQEEIYKAMTSEVLKGSAYAYSVLAERAYGKMEEKLNVSMNEGIVEKLTSGRKRIAKRD